MKYPFTIQNLIECFKRYPGVGTKTAERYALSTLKFDDELIELFSNSLLDLKKKVKKCVKCNNICEDEFCEICNDKTRNSSIICVVDDIKSIFHFEKLGIYNGYYYVLNALISPLDGINPSDINIDSLLKRVKDENIKECVIAIKSSIEGDTTALYLSKVLRGFDVLVSKLAHGVPLGADIDYIDSLTLEIALENREKIDN